MKFIDSNRPIDTSVNLFDALWLTWDMMKIVKTYTSTGGDRHFESCYAIRFVDEEKTIYVHSLDESVCLMYLVEGYIMYTKF